MLINRHKKEIHTIVLICIFVISAAGLFFSYKGFDFVWFKKSEMYSSRLSKDTLSGRIDQYKNAISIISSNLFGLGSYNSDKYFAASRRIGQVQRKEIYDYDLKENIGTVFTGLIVHNGFLGAGTRYGVFGLISYFMFCISSVVYSYRYYLKKKNNESLNLFLICIAWFLYQLTQDFSDLRMYHAVYFSIILAIYANYNSDTKRPHLKHTVA